MESSNQGNDRPRSTRGFASMDPQRQRAIASNGGRKAQENGTAHRLTSEEGREAGRKGGIARSQRYKARIQPAAVRTTPASRVDEVSIEAVFIAPRSQTSSPTSIDPQPE